MDGKYHSAAKNFGFISMRNSFLRIQHYCTRVEITPASIDMIENMYQEFFNVYRLDGIEWTLRIHENSVEFVPIRRIDKLAIKGLLEDVAFIN